MAVISMPRKREIFMKKSATVISKGSDSDFFRSHSDDDLNPKRKVFIATKRAHARKERSIAAWAYKSVHLQSIRVYQYGSRVRPTVEMAVHP